MTIIEKIHMRGFKSFAKPTDIEFGNHFNCVIGPNGSGKSVSYDTTITLSHGEEILIGELVEKQLKKAKAIRKLDDGVYCDNKENIKIVSLNPFFMKQEELVISKFIKRDSESYLYEIKTNCGKKVKTTGCHPLMVFRDGQIVSSLVKDLKEEDVIASPRIIKTSSYTKDKYFARIFGYIVGDGHIRSNRIEFVNKDKEIIEDYKKLILKLFNVKPKYEKTTKGVTRIICYQKEFISKVIELIKNNKDVYTTMYKYIPNHFLNKDLETISNLLAGLYDTDGSVRKDKKIIEFCTKNEKLANQIQRLLLRFNIIARKKLRICKATNTIKQTKRAYYYLYIEGQNNLEKFYYNISLKCKHKKLNLEEHLKNKKVANPNIDILPKNTNQLIKKAVLHLGIKCKPLRKQFPKLAAYTENRCCPTRQGLREILPILNDKLMQIYLSGLELKKDQFTLIQAMDILSISGRSAGESIGISHQVIRDLWATGKFTARSQNLDAFFDFIESAITSRMKELKNIMNTLHNLADSDIFWSKIISIKKIPGDKYVYDLAIPNNHNFIGNGIFLHNSNVMDALTFVLGKTSAKQMRAEKSSNLIYNGGKKGSPAREAEVSIYFSNKEKEFPLVTPSVKISRIVKQSGNSIYKINDDLHTRQQVVDVLSKAKIDPNGHNIVLQGDITSFVTMKPEERRLIIEDISGISLYEDKKQKALLELNKVEEKLNESNLILKERSVYMRELKQERDQAVRYKEIESKIKETKATFLHLQIREKEDKKYEVESKISKENEIVESINKKIKEFQKDLETKKQDLESINKEIEEKGEVEQVSLQKGLEALKEDLIKKTTRSDNLKTEISRIAQRISQLNKDKDEIQKRIRYLIEKKSKLESSDLKSQESRIKKQIENFKNHHNLSDFSSIEKLEAEIEDTQNNIFKLREEQNHLSHLIERNNLDLQRVEDNLQKQLSPENKNKIQNLKSVENKIDSLISRYNVTGTQIELNQENINKKRLELTNLEAAKIRITESLQNNLAVSTIMKAKFPGVYGTISTLGKVDERYSTALEVTAGARINSILVDTDLTAQKCINLLKEKKAGTSIFLPLNKIKDKIPQKELEQLKHFSGVKDIALNLIKFDKEYSKAFSLIFGSTLVVEDIQTARKVGIGRARMVTLDGDLIEVSGAMIGGYRRKTIGVFTHKDIAPQISTVEREIENYKDNLSNLQKERLLQDKQIEELKESKSILQAELARLNVENIDELKGSKSKLTKEIKEYQNSLNNVNKQIKESKSKLEKQKQIRKPAKTEDNLQKTLEELEAKQLELHGKLIQNYTELKNIQDQISTIHNPELEKIQEIIKQHNKELEEFDQELLVLGKDIQEKEKLVKERERKEVKFREDYKLLFVKRNKVQDIISKMETNLSKEDFKVREIEKKINEISVVKAKIIAEYEALQAEFEPYIGTKLRRNISKEDLKKELLEAEKIIAKFGNINMKALEVYEIVEKEYYELVQKSEALQKEKESVLELMALVEGKKKRVFMKTYKQIAENFKRIFLQLSTKGDAYLDLEDKENPLNGGLGVKVRIGGTKFLDLNSLSGGEKSLTALAFIFAIQEYEPSSFYLLDEVDAALDKANSQLLSKLIANHPNGSQYIVISHNDDVITEADQIYGVSMQQNGISKIISLKL